MTRKDRSRRGGYGLLRFLESPPLYRTRFFRSTSKKYSVAILSQAILLEAPTSQAMGCGAGKQNATVPEVGIRHSEFANSTFFITRLGV